MDLSRRHLDSNRTEHLKMISEIVTVFEIQIFCS